MFQSAYQIARQFTQPVVVSQRTVAGVCSSFIGAFVVVNPEGWIVTACHIFQAIDAIRASQDKVNAIRAARAQIETAGLDAREKKRRIHKVGGVPADGIDAWSAWWGKDPVSARDIAGLPDVDLAVARLEPFDSNWVPQYPIFKNPRKSFEPGRSLCKCGYPFHHIQPLWDDVAKIFRFPPDALPLPLFPIEGMFTRIAKLIGASDGPYAKLLVETSTPGLKGQSGGPTVDTSGVVWAIQSKTAHLPLGFDPEVPGRPSQREHQFLNVGLGVHTETVLGLFDELGIGYAVSID